MKAIPKVANLQRNQYCWIVATAREEIFLDQPNCLSNNYLQYWDRCVVELSKISSVPYYKDSNQSWTLI